MFHQKHESYKYVPSLKNWVDWITTKQKKKSHNLKNVLFEKNCPKIKKRIFPLMTPFCNVTLKLETSWVKNVVKPILDTWNVIDVIVYVWFISSWKKIKNMQCIK